MPTSKITEETTHSSNGTDNTLEEEKKMSSTPPNCPKNPKSHSSLYPSLWSKKNKMESFLWSRNKEKNNGNQDSTSSYSSSSSSTSSSSSKPRFSRSKSYTNGTSQAILNWLPCLSIDTNDATLGSGSGSANKKCPGKAISRPGKARKSGDSVRIFGVCWDYHQLHHADNNARKSCDGYKTDSSTRDFAACRPLSEPNCKQCGKPINPERWVKHVQSCKETKAMIKKAASSSRGEPSHKSFRNSQEG